jgi:signal transduction histidine kinase
VKLSTRCSPGSVRLSSESVASSRTPATSCVTPLAVMRTELDGALLLRPGEPDVRLALQAVRSECCRLTRLADDLLVLARLDEGRLPLRTTSVDLGELLMAGPGSVCRSGCRRGSLHHARYPANDVGASRSGSLAAGVEQPA